MTSSGKSGERIAFNAAKSITRVVDDLLNNEMLRGGQLHMFVTLYQELEAVTLTLVLPVVSQVFLPLCVCTLSLCARRESCSGNWLKIMPDFAC